MDSVYFDIRKAFDSVSHTELLNKFQSFGIGGTALNFIKGYLNSRVQCVSVNNELSGYLPVTSGVPQGSILGPLLFIAYSNDLSEYATSAQIFIFADDTKMCQEIKTLQDCKSLQADINQIHTWSSNCLLRLHPDKTCIMSFCPSKAHPFEYNYNLDGRPIYKQFSVKDLGVILSSDLSWSEHINKTLGKAYRAFHLIRRTFSSATTPTHIKKYLYLSLILPILTYASPVWRPHMLKDIIALETFQKRATKYMLNYNNLDYKSRLTSLKILPLMYRLEMLDLMFYIGSKKNAGSHFDITNFITDASSTSTRSHTSFKLKHRACTTNSNRHFYFNRLPRLWNSLKPIDPNQSTSTIKLHIQKYIINHFTAHFDPNNPCTFHSICPCSSCSCTPSSINYH